jgi:5-methylcytosine-specific restriction endonuclease McrA
MRLSILACDTATISNNNIMRYSSEQLDRIHAKTDGHCHTCGDRIIRSHHGRIDVATGWHVDHSKAKVKGGTDHPNNLYPACWECNLRKQTMSARAMRRRNGLTQIPPSRAQKQAEADTTFGFAIGIGALGLLLMGIARKSQASSDRPSSKLDRPRRQEFY